MILPKLERMVSPASSLSIREGYNSTCRGEIIPVTIFFPAISRDCNSIYNHLLWSFFTFQRAQSGSTNESSFMFFFSSGFNGYSTGNPAKSWYEMLRGMEKNKNDPLCKMDFWDVFLKLMIIPNTLPETCFNSFLPSGFIAVWGWS